MIEPNVWKRVYGKFRFDKQDKIPLKRVLDI